MVSIGTPSRAKDFVNETGFPADRLFADPENRTYDSLRLNKSVSDTFFRPTTPLSIMQRMMKDSAKDLQVKGDIRL